MMEGDGDATASSLWSVHRGEGAQVEAASSLLPTDHHCPHATLLSMAL